MTLRGGTVSTEAFLYNCPWLKLGLNWISGFMLGDSARQSPFMEWNGAELWRRRIHLKCPTSDSNCNEFHAIPSAKMFFHVKKIWKLFCQKNRENVKVQNVNVARFARNVKCDFFVDFQTLWCNSCHHSSERYTSETFFQQSTSSKLKDVKLWGWKMCTQAKEMKLQWRRNSKTLMTKRGNHCSPPILHIPRFLNTKFLQNTRGGKSETKMTVWISLQNRSLLHDYRWRAYHFESLNNGKESLF